MNPMSQLVGAQLEEYDLASEGANFQFNTGILAAFNPVEIGGNKNSLIGSKVDIVTCLEEKLEIIFSTGAYISISLLPEHYIGPEAFCMHFANGIIVVE